MTMRKKSSAGKYCRVQLRIYMRFACVMNFKLIHDMFCVFCPFWISFFRFLFSFLSCFGSFFLHSFSVLAATEWLYKFPMKFAFITIKCSNTLTFWTCVKKLRSISSSFSSSLFHIVFFIPLFFHSCFVCLIFLFLLCIFFSLSLVFWCSATK